MTAELENILAELLAGELDEQERLRLLAKVRSDPEAWEVYQMVIHTDEILEEAIPTSPSMRFTKEVMLGYDRLVLMKKNNQLMFYFSAVAMALVLGIVVLSMVFENGTSSPISLPNLQVEGIIFAVDTIADKKTIFYGFGLVNIVLLMVLLDKYLRRKNFNMNQN